MISRLVSFYSRVGRKPYDHPFIHGTEVPSMNRDIIQGHHYPDVGKLDVKLCGCLAGTAREK